MGILKNKKAGGFFLRPANDRPFICLTEVRFRFSASTVTQLFFVPVAGELLCHFNLATNIRFRVYSTVALANLER